MAEKGKHKTTIVAVCYRCSRSRLGTCGRKGDFVCVAGSPRPTAFPTTAFPFSSPFEVETVTHMLSEEVFFASAEKVTAESSAWESQIASPDDANLLF